MYFIILLLLIVLFFSQKILIIESYKNNSSENNVFLIGDSILQNTLYATPSIEDFLSEKINEQNIFFFAEDNTTISQCASQTNLINKEYNNKKSFIFVSVGGNDILNKIVYTNNPTREIVDEIISEYELVFNPFLEKMNKSNIILLNIYYPTNSYFHKYYTYIDIWNHFIKEFAKKNNCKLLDLTKIMNQPNDFSFRIEPSAIGGKKISNHIISYLT
jgi:hypothetical protein